MFKPYIHCADKMTAVAFKHPLQNPDTQTIGCYHHTEPSHCLSTTSYCQQANVKKNTRHRINNNIGLSVNLTQLVWI